MHNTDHNRASAPADEVSISVAGDGGVACPLAGNVTLDRCRECDLLRAVTNDAAGRTHVQCATAPFFGSWMLG